MSAEIESVTARTGYQITPAGEGIYSIGNPEEWNEQRRLDMQFIGALMALAEKHPEKFTGRAIHEILSSLPIAQGNRF